MKKIQLGGHQKNSKIKGYALVDDEDFEWLNRWKWCMSKNNGYAIHDINTKKLKERIRMHRLILDTPQGMLTDHINGDKLDNRRSNLRICTMKENTRNRRMSKKNTSGYKGVRWHKRNKKWMVVIKEKHIGQFNNKIDAAKVYNQKAKELFGEFARLNII